MLLLIIYIAFISLGLPDSLLGSAWPVMYQELGVGLSASGTVFMIIAAGTVVSSLCSDRLIRRFGTGKITAVSVLTTAVAMLGFSFSHRFWLLCLWAVPYGLGAGSVDAALNNFVALHFESRHMSWLHCMWGVGASLGPTIMGAVLYRGGLWNSGYRVISLLQFVLVAVLFGSLPLWRQKTAGAETSEGEAKGEVLHLPALVRLPGAKETMLCFFCYCALEQTTGLWASSYLVTARGVAEITAARCGSLFYLGITLGRAVSGFVTMKLNDDQMVHLGEGIIALGVLCILIPAANALALLGFVLVGLGCAPVYPSMIHATPAHFGRERSQAIVGVQMASAYMGTSLMPPFFGLLIRWTGTRFLPVYLGVLLLLMAYMHSRIGAVTRQRR
ncbi:MAG: MFS transporter [Oscillospiraceae bacterium]|nr:MFS transporter [Oscillospiraceae bacterium]